MTISDEPWTVGRLLSWTTEFLGRHSAENPRLDAEVLLSHARKCRRIDLYVAFDDVPNEETLATFRDFVRRRSAGVPVAYLVGHREFYALEFEVTPDVLIPRPETELLVVALLDWVKKRPENSKPVRIADVGTGSGILAVCAAKYVPTARVTAMDISPAALAVARRNAEHHGVAERIDFIESDLFASVSGDLRFDAVVSNPPYVSTAEMAELPADVREHEPRIALEAGEQGTEVVERLVTEAAQRLNAGGFLAIEISPMITERVERCIREDGRFAPLPTLRDLAGHARVVQAIAAKIALEADATN
jgi:release factor glutamine methyltransferase